MVQLLKVGCCFLLFLVYAFKKNSFVPFLERFGEGAELNTGVHIAICIWKFDPSVFKIALSLLTT